MKTDITKFMNFPTIKETSSLASMWHGALKDRRYVHCIGYKRVFSREMEFTLEHRWNSEYKTLISHYTIQIM